MSERVHLLVQQWLQSSLSGNDTNGSLQKLSETFPYFSAAHILRLHTANTADENYSGFKKEAALHVYNPLQLENWPQDEMFQIPFEEKVEANAELKTNTPIVPEEIVPEEEPIVPAEAILLEPETESNRDESEPIAETFADENRIEPVENNAPIEATQDEQQQNAEPDLKIAPINLQAPAGDITFEPYHTVDYFASQGIKLSKTEVGNDQFGKQLKSFTDWLKTMKKLPTTAITQNTDGVGEKRVENLAAHSLQHTDILTESMAEVWIKQGNLQKASEVYNKLSLQNPSKKAYFAAKIESLKKPS